MPISVWLAVAGFQDFLEVDAEQASPLPCRRGSRKKPGNRNCLESDLAAASGAGLFEIAYFQPVAAVQLGSAEGGEQALFHVARRQAGQAVEGGSLDVVRG